MTQCTGKKDDLLILTQKVDINDPFLGFFHGWVRKFAQYYERVIVICLQEGEHNLPANVRILSLGKEKKVGRLKYIWRFYRYIWQERKNYDKVFVHMNREYVLFGGWLWRLWGKRVGLWHAHKIVDSKLRIAEKTVNVIFTASSESCRIQSGKVRVVGHGIDVEKFGAQTSKPKQSGEFKIITVGRIAPVKNYETLVKATKILAEDNVNFRVDIIGGAGLPEQWQYLESLKKMVAENNLEQKINFLGPVPNKDIADYLQKADLFVNMSATGSLDKAILEAMACGLPVVTCNEAAMALLNEFKDYCVYKQEDSRDLALKIKKIIKHYNESNILDIRENFKKLVFRDHSLDGLIKKIVHILSTI